MADSRNRNILNDEIDPFEDAPVRTMEQVARSTVGRELPPARGMQPATPKGLIVQGDRAVIAPDGTIHYAGYRLTKTGLIPPEELREADWRKLGGYLFGVDNALQWWIGDFLDQGERVWKHTIEEVAEVTGKDVGTLYNWTSIARKFDFSRRREKLTFTHHVEVASLPADMQEYWLDQAENAGGKPWSTRQLRTAMKPKPGPKGWLERIQSGLSGFRKRYEKAELGELVQAHELMRQEIQRIKAEIERRQGGQR